MPMASAKARACSMSRRARLGESASTASIRSPSTRCAVAARNAESTPPEYATITPPSARSRSSSACNFNSACSSSGARAAMGPIIRCSRVCFAARCRQRACIVAAALPNSDRPDLWRDRLYFDHSRAFFKERSMNMQGIRRLAAVAAFAIAIFASPLRSMAQGDTVLKAADAQKLLPPAVYYKGHSASTQLRNSGGVKFSDGAYVLATLVDTSGYSSDVQAKYQAYFITETPIKIGGQSLPTGVYGVGFIANDKFIVTDVGAHDLFTVGSSNDQEIKRPMPLQVTTDPAGGFRLYEGRRYVTFSR